MSQTTTQIDNPAERCKAQKSASCAPFDEGLELLDCEGQLLQNEEEDDDDSDDGERSEDQGTVTSEDATTGEQNIIPLATSKAIPAPTMLTELYEDDSDLHKDAVFLASSGSCYWMLKLQKIFART